MASTSEIAQSAAGEQEPSDRHVVHGDELEVQLRTTREVVPDSAQVIEERVVVERLDRFSLQRAPGCEHRAAIVCLPPSRDRLATAARRAPRRAFLARRRRPGWTRDMTFRTTAGGGLLDLPRLGSGSPSRAHPRVAVVVHEAHVEVVDRQPVPLGTPAETELERLGGSLLEHPRLPAPHVHLLQLPPPAAGRVPRHGHSPLLRSGSRAASASVRIAHCSAWPISSASSPQ